MAISFDCPACSEGINAPDETAGRDYACPRCGATVQVPSRAVDDFEDMPPLRTIDDASLSDRKKTAAPRNFPSAVSENRKRRASPGVKLVATLVGLAVALVLFWGAYVWQHRFVTFEDAEKTFRVDFPGSLEVVESSEETTMPNGRKVRPRFYIVTSEGYGLSVCVLDTDGDGELGRNLADGSFRRNGLEIVETSRLDRKGHSVSRIIGKGRMQGRPTEGLAEVYVVGERSFILFALTHTKIEEDPVVRHFCASFEPQ